MQLPKSTHAVNVELWVHTLNQMTLEWPSFGGLQQGSANLAKLPNIDTLSIESKVTGTSKHRSDKKHRVTKARWSFARRQVDADISDDEAPGTLREVAAKGTHRDATMEDVHAMVMAIVDQEYETYGRLGWPPAHNSLFTLRDSSGAMLVHNLLLAGAQVGYRVTVSYSPDPTPTPAADRQRAYQPMPVHITNPSLKP